MFSDVSRQRKAANGKLFDVNGNTSLGSLPRGNAEVRKDTMMITSPKQVKDFQIGSKERTAPVPTEVAIRGLARYKERNDLVSGRDRGAQQGSSAASASLTPDGVVSNGVTTGEAQVAGSDTAFVGDQGLLNPTNRLESGGAH